MLRSLHLRAQAHALAKIIIFPLLMTSGAPTQDSITIPLTAVSAHWHELAKLEGGAHDFLVALERPEYIMSLLIRGKEHRVLVDTARIGLLDFFDDHSKEDRLDNGLDNSVETESVCLPWIGEKNDQNKGGHPQNCISMPFSMIKNMRNASDPIHADGVLGLGVSSFARFHSNMFALRLAHPSYGPSAPSEITFGGFRSENCDGRIQWIKLLASSEPPDLWQAGLRQILLSRDNQWPAKPLNTKHAVCQVTHQHNLCEAAVDSAVPLIAGPASYIEKLLDTLRIDPSCNNFDTLPAIFFEVAGDISGSLSYTPVYLQLTRFEYVARERYGDKWTCTPLFQTRPSDANPPWLLGQPLLHRYYSIFDASLKRMGFALQRRPQVVQEKSDASAATAASGACHDDEVEMAAWSLPSCAKFADYGYCKHHKRVAARSCPATCELCKGGNHENTEISKRNEQAFAFVQGRGLRVATTSSHHVRLGEEI